MTLQDRYTISRIGRMLHRFAVRKRILLLSTRYNHLQSKHFGLIFIFYQSSTSELGFTYEYLSD